MRILHIVNKLSDKGNGIVNLAVDVAVSQQRSGHTVAFLTGPEGGYESFLASFGIEIISVPHERTPTQLFRAGLGFGRALRHFKPDVVHAHMQTGLLLVLPWTRLYRIPLVSHLHNVHDAAVHRMGWADRVIAVSTAVHQSLRELGVPASKIRTVLNGSVGSPRLPAIAALTPAPLLHPAILTVAGMSHRKGISELLQAFERVSLHYPEAHLYLAGEGPERVLFEQQAVASSASERIHFLGFTAMPQQLMLASDVFVLASRRDSFGLVLAEAREAGCAIIASDVDGIPEALDFGAAGLLVPPQSPSALAEAILLLLSDPDLRAQWQQRARTGLERFTVARMTNELMAVYRDLVTPAATERNRLAPGRSARLQ